MKENQIVKALAEIRDLLKRQHIQTKDTMSFKEAIIYLGVSKSFLYKLTSEGKITYSKPGGKLTYFRKQDLDNWLLQNQTKSICDYESNLNDYLKRNENGRQQ